MVDGTSMGLNCPLNEKIFLWVFVDSKVPIWDNLMKLYLTKPRRCSLCCMEGEHLTHMFIGCSCLVEMWRYVSDITHIQFVWDGDDLNDALQRWLNNSTFQNYKALLALLIWGAQLVQNKHTFQDTFSYFGILSTYL